MRKRTILLTLAAALAVTALAAPVAATPATPTGKAVPNVMRWGATLEWGGFQVSGDFIYGHSPGGGDYATKGAWNSGTVMEARGYFVEKAGGDIYVATRWRTRRGTTAILSDWNTGGSNSDTYSVIDSYTTHFSYGYRDDYPDHLSTSAILLTSYPDCSQQAGVDTYAGGTFIVTANPAGATDTVSGNKNQLADQQVNNLIDCGEQA
jgi:hypothetical protein